MLFTCLYLISTRRLYIFVRVIAVLFTCLYLISTRRLYIFVGVIAVLFTCLYLISTRRTIYLCQNYFCAIYVFIRYRRDTNQLLIIHCLNECLQMINATVRISTYYFIVWCVKLNCFSYTNIKSNNQLSPRFWLRKEKNVKPLIPF